MILILILNVFFFLILKSNLALLIQINHYLTHAPRRVYHLRAHSFNFHGHHKVHHFHLALLRGREKLGVGVKGRGGWVDVVCNVNNGNLGGGILRHLKEL